MSVFSYLRVSPKPDGKADPADSLDTQESACREYCQRAKLELTAAFRDSEVSARKTKLADRPAGAALLAAIKPRDTIVCYRLDRVFRDVVDGLQTLERWATADIILATADGQTFSVSKAAGWLAVVMQLVMAAYEPRATAERTSDAMQNHQRNGRLMSRRAPYGWDAVDGLLIANEAEQRIRDGANNMANNGRTTAQIADVLNEDGASMRSGQQWTARSVRRLLL